MPSSSSQNPDEPSGLLKILASVFSGVLFGLFLSKLDTPTENDRKSVHPQNNPRPETPLGPLQIPVAPQVPPAPTKQYYPDRRKDDTQRWKKNTEIVAVGIAGGLLVANIFVTVGTWKAAKAAKHAANTADATLKSSQQSFETDQRPYVVTDGVPSFSFNAKTKKVNFAEASIRLKNTGRTPAFDTFSAVRFDRWDFTGPGKQKTVPALVVAEDTVFSNVSEGMRIYNAEAPEILRRILLRQDMAPGANNYFTTNDLISPLPESDVVKLQNGDTVLIFTGIARYTGFGHTYETAFCFYYLGTDSSVWHYCAHNNSIK
jgi:hypothetical protein